MKFTLFHLAFHQNLPLSLPYSSIYSARAAVKLLYSCYVFTSRISEDLLQYVLTYNISPLCFSFKPHELICAAQIEAIFSRFYIISAVGDGLLGLFCSLGCMLALPIMAASFADPGAEAALSPLLPPQEPPHTPSSP